MKQASRSLLRVFPPLSLALLLASTCVLAGNIYKYQDKNGIWHFTDQEPLDNTEFEAVYMEKEAEPRVRMRREGTDSSPVYHLFNDYWGPVEVEVKLSEAINVLSEPLLPSRFVVPGQKEMPLVGLGAADPRQGFSYRLHLVSVPGPPNPELITGLDVHPPFPSEMTFLVSQGFNGERTHQGPESQYAIDIVMPVGTPVLAVRSGRVMDIEEDFNSGGTDLEKYVDKANHVRVLHDDGSMALYAHIDLASVPVRPGAQVRAGQLLARSGNTGFSTGPHLHFVIQQNVGMQLVSVPFRFYQSQGGAAEPRENTLVQGTQPLR